MDDNIELFRKAPGSRANHQAYPGGYLDHIGDCMKFAWDIYSTFPVIKMEALPKEEQFDVADATIVMFLHDLEKPWLYGEFPHLNLSEKWRRRQFRLDMIKQYDIQLEEKHWAALDQVEGIRDADYDPNSRGFTPLGAFCHTLDLLSARVFYQ